METMRALDYTRALPRTAAGCRVSGHGAGIPQADRIDRVALC
jgi:hypothetical protein